MNLKHTTTSTLGHFSCKTPRTLVTYLMNKLEFLKQDETIELTTSLNPVLY